MTLLEAISEAVKELSAEIPSQKCAIIANVMQLYLNAK